MIWWVLTFLYIDRTLLTLFIRAHTNFPDHLWMKWSTYEPARTPIWRTVRGKAVFCGYKYIWDTPFLTEQHEHGDTIERTFFLEYLLPTDHIWFYLCAPAERSGREIQGPLIHVPPLEPPMPSARIFRSTNQVIPAGTPTYLIFDSVLWDTHDFFDPAQPDRLTIPATALYEVGCCVHWMTGVEANAWVRIRDGTPDTWVYHTHYISDTGWAGAGFTMSCPIALLSGDFLRVQVYNSHAVQKEISAIHHYTPHFWIYQIGLHPS